MKYSADWALIQQLIDSRRSKTITNTCEGHPVIDQSITLVPEDVEAILNVVPPIKETFSTMINVKVVRETIVVYLPNSMLQQPAHKKRKKPQKSDPPQILLEIVANQDVLEDMVLFREVKRLSGTLLNTFGPVMSVSQDFVITIDFAAYLSINYRDGFLQDSSAGQNLTISRVFSRLLHIPELARPTIPQVATQDMFHALALSKPFSEDPVRIPRLMTELHPFQRQTLRWLLYREFKQIDSSGEIVDSDDKTPLFLGWKSISSSASKTGTLWINPYSVEVSEIEPAPEYETHRGGGLLAEEMGLGKSLEIIALILANARDPSQLEEVGTVESPRKIRATLIIVPTGILQQWVTELEVHAPKLKVCRYTDRSEANSEVKVTDLASADIVLCSYSALSAEIHAASFVPGQRNTRHWRKREDIEKVRSALVQVEFWRVILDEAQMIQSGVSNAAQVASMIPRVHAWAVSGTPVKASLMDLKGQFGFFKLHPFSGTRAFERLLTMPDDFTKIISMVGIRHTKAMLKDQLVLPPQKRMLIAVKLTELERHFYSGTLDEFKAVFNSLNERSSSSWLVKLRQACCLAVFKESHLGSGVTPQGSALTIDQVMQKLLDEVESLLQTRIRSTFQSKVELCRIDNYLGDHLGAIDRLKEIANFIDQKLKSIEDSIPHYEQEKKESDKLMSDASVQYLAAEEKESALFKVLQEEHDAKIFASVEEEQRHAADVEKLPEVQEVKQALSTLQRTLADAKFRFDLCSNKIKSRKIQLRGWQELKYQVYFSIATAYRSLNQKLLAKESKDLYEEEALYFDKAEEISNILLSDALQKVATCSKRVKDLKLFRFEKPTTSAERYLNSQADLIETMRNDEAKILEMPLLDQQATDDMDANAYMRSMELQDQAFVIHGALKELYQSRSSAISLDKKELNGPKMRSREEITERKVDRTDAYFKCLQETRKQVKSLSHKRPTRSLQTEVYSLSKEDPSHKQKHEDYDKARENLTAALKDWNNLQDLYNARVVYYKGLQELSDQVEEKELSEDELLVLKSSMEKAIEGGETEEANLESKMRYTKQLQEQANMDLSSDCNSHANADEECPICQDPYTLGLLTVCGHKFCAVCLSGWLHLRKHCPLCKSQLTKKDVFRFKIGENDDSTKSVSRLSDLHNEIYAHISRSKFTEILQEPVKRPYGVKIDTILRHVLNLKRRDPDVKIVIYSQWAKFLSGLLHALVENGVGAIMRTKPQSVYQFKIEMDLTCFLLHTRHDSAGLTLTNATHVILCEPMLTTALELQAISRVHRIGQNKPTTVWLFSVESTVEQAILNLSTQRRLKIASKRGEEEVESNILESSSGELIDRSSGSEVVGASDVRKLLEETSELFDKATSE